MACAPRCDCGVATRSLIRLLAPHFTLDCINRTYFIEIHAKINSIPGDWLQARKSLLPTAAAAAAAALPLNSDAWGVFCVWSKIKSEININKHIIRWWTVSWWRFGDSICHITEKNIIWVPSEFKACIEQTRELRSNFCCSPMIKTVALLSQFHNTNKTTIMTACTAHVYTCWRCVAKHTSPWSRNQQNNNQTPGRLISHISACVSNAQFHIQ